MINKLELDSVILEYGSKRILQDVYLKSETGKVTGVLGRNGTGKSSLMQILFGEVIPNHKSIRINDHNLVTPYRSPEDLRYLPQNRFIPKSLSINRIFKDFELNFNDFTTEFPGFEKFYKSKLVNLSGGEVRIIEIYIILVCKTKFCMLDEPFSQVMPIHIETIKKLILREKRNKGIIITDHLYQHVIDICDDLYVLNDGKIILTQGAKDLETMGYTQCI